MSRRQNSSQTDRAGVHGVGSIIAKEFDWIFREQHEKDHGVDAQIEICHRGQPTGRLIAAQIKAGQSYFKEETADGFTFRGEPKHLKYWLRHKLPVIVILFDSSNGSAYWQVVARINLTLTEKAWKMTIPKAQRLRRSTSETLEQVSEGYFAVSDPQCILNAARKDRIAGRFEQALRKHVWFHEYALKYQRGLAGVRLSYALNDWASLAEVYPPARKKLLCIRRENVKRIKEGIVIRDTFASFHDFMAINRSLDAQTHTITLFAWLHKNRPEVARRVFNLALPALVKARKFKLCNRYLEPNESFSFLAGLLCMETKNVKTQEFREEFKRTHEMMFRTKVATLVALLVLNKREAEAEEIATKAILTFNDAKLKTLIADARRGRIPEKAL